MQLDRWLRVEGRRPGPLRTVGPDPYQLLHPRHPEPRPATATPAPRISGGAVPAFSTNRVRSNWSSPSASPVSFSYAARHFFRSPARPASSSANAAIGPSCAVMRMVR
ncbi:hypothetical protein M877_14815 [Streptomyces niveus NCIMB 11891]|nr:hypothetical protein M877_14815 [Streptomyces niveus NCIMB 11891]